MAGENPYAPPLTAETEAPASRTWRVDGIGVLVKHLATLPMVDLNSGEQGEDMKCVPRSLVKVNPHTLIATAAITAAYFALSKHYNISVFLFIITLVVVNVVGQRILTLRGTTSQKLDIMEHLGKKSLNRLLRRRIRVGVYLAVVTLFVAGAMRFIPYFPGVFLVLVVIGLGVWTFFDRARAKSLSGPPGWMRISPVHPDALSFLANLQQQEDAVTAAAEAAVATTTDMPPHRKRRTIWFHKYPLAMLIGQRRNPLAILDIALAKLFRSPLLTRETWHFSDAVPTPLEDLCMETREETGAWIMAHPDWVVRSAEKLVYPGGDIIVESVHLTPPSFEHDLWLVCSWHVANPSLRSFQRTIVSWVAGGRRITTVDHQVLPLKYTDEEVHRAKGNVEHLYQAHLSHCAGKPLDPPRDEADRAARISAKQEETDRLLTELGYQSELR